MSRSSVNERSGDAASIEAHAAALDHLNAALLAAGPNADRFDLKRDIRFRFILIFKNHGAAAGEATESLDSNVLCGWFYLLQAGQLKFDPSSRNIENQTPRTA